MSTQRLTAAQALVAFLRRQWVARDGAAHPFFAGCLGIFGHGNVAGLGQALQQTPEFPYYLVRNEQAMVHTAAAFAKQSQRLRAFACTSSIGPGATNMITGAALATINRLPVLLLPGDLFARRNVAPVLQQLELPSTQDISVNDCFRPVSRYWDRIQRPEQLLTALPEAMRVLTSPAETGAVTIALPQDVQAEAYDFPAEFFAPRVWRVQRPRGDAESLRRAAAAIRAARQPLIIAGGGVRYSGASAALADFARRTGIPVAETQAGKGALPFDHPLALGAMGVTGTPGANILAREADLILGIGTRYTDFTTQSKTAFQNPAVRFVNINVAEFDAYKHSAIPLVADARAAIEELGAALAGYQTAAAYRARAARFQAEWDQEVSRIYALRYGPPLSQGEVLGAVNASAQPRDVMICASGSMPGDLHKLWRARDPESYHMEYGYSCMGYEIAGGIGAKMAAPDREVYVLVGDGSYLMMAQELATAVQEGVKIIVVVLDNHGHASINGLSQAVGAAGYGTLYRRRLNGQLQGPTVAVDFAANAASLGVPSVRVRSHQELVQALADARAAAGPVAVVVETALDVRVPDYESWWDVPIAEVAATPQAQAVYPAYAAMRAQERSHLEPAEPAPAAASDAPAKAPVTGGAEAKAEAKVKVH